WNFGDGTTGTGAKPTHRYAARATPYTPSVTVSDGKGGTASKTLPAISVTDGAPTATMTSPTASTRWTGGGTLTLTGSGTDSVDGTLSGSALSWKVVRRNDSVTVATRTGASASWPVPADRDADTTYDVTLTATDSAGNTSTAGPVRV